MQRLMHIVNTLYEKKIISQIINGSRIFPDEPELNFYFCIQNPDAPLPHSTAWNFVGSFCSLDENRAFQIAVLKTIEKYSLFSLETCDFIHASYEELKEEKIDLVTIIKKVNAELLIEYPDIITEPLGWVTAYNHKHKKYEYVPAQFIYPAYYGKITYNTSLNEPYLIGQYQIINGSAASFEKDVALRNALYEVIERDTFTNSYLYSIVPVQLDIATLKDPSIQKIYELLKERGMEVYLFILTLDIKVPTFLSVIVDPRKGKNALSYGYCAGFNVSESIQSSLEKAILNKFQVQIQMKYSKSRVLFTQLDTNYYFGNSLLKKGLVLPRRTFQRLKFLFNQKFMPDRLPAISYNTATVDKEIKTLLSLLDRRGFDMWIRSLTDPFFSDSDIYVCKIFVPGLQDVLYDNMKGICLSRKETIRDYI